MSGIPSFWRCVRDSLAFRSLPQNQRRIVFYSEGKQTWPFLKGFIRSLLDSGDETPAYVSSATDDPGLAFAPKRMKGFVVGSGFFLIHWFQSLKADVLAMSTPDLEVFHVKRSLLHPVHYTYLMHGTDSVSMVLRERALDSFDSIFCSGPHNVEEIRRRERLKSLREKELYEVGYPYLDDLIRAAEDCTEPNRDDFSFHDLRRPRVLLAPSWSENREGILDLCGAELVGALLEADFEVVLRPHPRTMLLHRSCVDPIVKACSKNPRFTLETDTSRFESLMRADVLISDWSAITMEYAFSRLRPVLLIDVPPKAVNPNYKEIGLEPFEITVREKIGKIIDPKKIDTAPEAVRLLCREAAQWREKIRNVRDENVFHVGRAGRVGAEILLNIADKARRRIPTTG